MAYFTSATLYKVSIDEELGTSLVAASVELLSGEVCSFYSYSTQIYNAVFAFLEEEKKAASGANRTLCNALMTQDSHPVSENMGAIHESIAVAVQAFHRSKKDSKKSANSVCNTFASSSISLLVEALQGPAASPSIFPLLSSFSGSASFRHSASVRRFISAPVVEVSSTDYVEAQEISRMITAESVGESDETPPPGLTRTFTRETNSKALAQAPTP